MPRETNIHDAIRRAVEKLGCCYTKIHGSIYGKAGTPDVLISVWIPNFPYRIALYVEVKQPGNTPTPLQLRRIDEINERGDMAMWTDNAQAVTEKICAIREVVGEYMYGTPKD